jgi:hypothetical protein
MSSATNAEKAKSASYYCADEASGGLKYNKELKKWEGVRFRTDYKFVLRLKYLRTDDHRRRFETLSNETVNVYEVTITEGGESKAWKCVSVLGSD